MKKIITFALASIMTLASSIMVFAEAEPIAAITNAYTFEKAERSEATVDKFNNPFKDGGNDAVSIQYTVTIPASPSFLSGYDTVMTFGTKDDGFVYVCNELVGMNNSGFVDFWPSGELGKLVYPGKGESYTVNLVFSADGVAFYRDGELQPGSNVSAANADGNVGERTGQDILDSLNTEEFLYIGENNTSYWATQDMVLSNIVFFKGDQVAPYTLTGAEAKATRPGETATEEATTKKPVSGGEGVVEVTTAPEETTTATANANEEESKMLKMVMIIVVVVIVAAIGVSAMVIMTSKRRR